MKKLLFFSVVFACTLSACAARQIEPAQPPQKTVRECVDQISDAAIAIWGDACEPVVSDDGVTILAWTHDLSAEVSKVRAGMYEAEWDEMAQAFSEVSTSMHKVFAENGHGELTSTIKIVDPDDHDVVYFAVRDGRVVYDAPHSIDVLGWGNVIPDQSLSAFADAFPDCEVKLRFIDGREEIAVISKFNPAEKPDDWDSICDRLISSLDEYTKDRVASAQIETLDGTILANAYRGRIMYSAFVDPQDRPVTIEMVLANATQGERNAYEAAVSYLEVMPFSHDGLVSQLEFEKYTHKEAVFGADNCGADWYYQAERMAKSYLKSFSFSRQSLIDQLMFEGFTEAEASYGATRTGY